MENYCIICSSLPCRAFVAWFSVSSLLMSSWRVREFHEFQLEGLRGIVVARHGELAGGSGAVRLEAFSAVQSEEGRRRSLDGQAPGTMAGSKNNFCVNCRRVLVKRLHRVLGICIMFLKLY